MPHIPLAYVVMGSLIAHIVITSVMALFARYKVRYLSIAWITGIFSLMLAILLPFCGLIEVTRPATLHPGPMFGFMVWVFLQSIYPLSIPMPGYLQWERMWTYALPVIIVGLAYGILTVFGMTAPNYYSVGEVLAHFWTADVWLRLAMLGVSIYYIINIFRLPKVMLRIPDVPHYLFGYATLLGLNSCLYLWLVISFTVGEFELWLVVFTLANLYICLRELETMAIHLPKPVIEAVGEAPEVNVIEQTDREDFNEANRQRFERVEFWMQHNRDAWKDFTFSRDNLCENTGINRHLLLQALRSQGYNNVHEYINAYRVEELKRLVANKQIQSMKDCMDAGFGTIKTARAAFLRVQGETLDDYLAHYYIK